MVAGLEQKEKRRKGEKIMKGLKFFCTILFIICSMPICLKAAEITIGTGGTQGVYYPTGLNICSMLNSKPEYQNDCTALSTSGSIDNITEVVNGTIQFGIAQSDQNYFAWNGLYQWQSDPQSKLRSVFSIHAEYLTLIAGVDTDIQKIQDLMGKTVNIGYTDSSWYQTVINLLNSYGLNYETDMTALTYKANEALPRFLSEEIDAFFVFLGHPNDLITNATQRASLFIPITENQAFIETYPYYTESEIPLTFYPDINNIVNVKTLSLKATLITSTDVDESTVYSLTKEIFNNFYKFREMHDAYYPITKNAMLKGLTAPIHSGAMKYYKEVMFLMDIDGNQKTGLEEAIHALQVLAGIRNQ